MTSPNAFSAAWIDAFLRRRDPARTALEAAFVARHCPRAEFPRILDVPCGLGRHSHALASLGYRVTGVDRNQDLVAEAHFAAPHGAEFHVGDMTRLGEIPDEFDAAICLWQSFGYLDDAGNAAVLRGIAGRLRPGGRLVLDVFHRGFFERHEGRREFEVGGTRITEERRLSGNRENVRLTYSGGRPDDVFEWRLYVPEELIRVAAGAGFRCLATCARFDDAVPASDAEPQMQFVFERKA
jgi:SAM-dependent methyltransferase